MSASAQGHSWPAALIIGAVLFLLVIAFLVAASLAPRATAEFARVPVVPRAAPDSLVIDTVTIDAGDEHAWRFFHLATRAVRREPDSAGWDLAFRRFHVVSSGGAADLGDVAFDAVREAPEEGYLATVFGRDTVNAALERWYTYSFLSHVLSPNGHVIALRTRDGRYAKLQFLSYYCTGSSPGCVTIRYAYQGDGSRALGR